MTQPLSSDRPPTVGPIPVPIRPVLPSEGPLIDAFVRHLSPETSYRRFLAPVPRLSPAQVGMIVNVDHRDRETLVAVAREGCAESVVGFAQYVRVSDVSAEMAVVVADDWQRRGIGTALLRRLLLAAGTNGFEWLTGEFLSTNRGILRLVSRLGHVELLPQGRTSVMLLRVDHPATAQERHLSSSTPTASARTPQGSDPSGAGGAG